MVEYISGSSGIILGAVTGLSIFYTYYFTLSITDYFLGNAKDSFLHAVAIAVGATFYPLDFIRPYLLADGLAIALALMSVAILVRRQHDLDIQTFISATLVAGLAGLTQTYALIPFLLLCGTGGILCFFSNKRLFICYALAMLCASLIFLIVTYLWRVMIPHLNTPENFTLLKFSGGMLQFYLQTWGFYFAPLFIFFILARRYSILLNFKNHYLLAITIIAILFAALCFFYQWPEARFTYYLWPWVMILFFSVIRPFSPTAASLILIPMFILIFLVPQNYWNPSWSTIKFSSTENWVSKYFTTLSVNRGFDTCEKVCSGGNAFLQNSDGYVNSTVNLYLKIKGL